MKNKLIAIMTVVMMAATMASPALAADDTPLGQVGGLLGATTATIIDVPEGILYHSLYNCPLKTTQYLIDAFGGGATTAARVDQAIVAGAIGIPVGFLWGIPYGAIRGGTHGMTTGWEEPFSTNSYIVIEEN